MTYQDYFRAYQVHRDTIRSIDDALALWLETDFPNHDSFEWFPETETTIDVWIKWYKPERSVNIKVPVEELIPEPLF